MSIDVTIPCLHEDLDGEQCSLDVNIQLEYEPGEMYGSDADGRRGVWRDGYLYGGEDAVCPAGHPVKDSQERAEAEAERCRDYGD